MTTVMLSQPMPPVSESRARHLVIMFSAMVPSESPCATARRVKSTTCCDDKQSQIPAGSAYRRDRGVQKPPSQASTMNSSSPSILCSAMSGSAVTICFSGSSEKFCLNSKSPMARDRARLPFTRPNSTNPPAARIRAVSSLFVGLWSSDRALAWPWYPSTVRESPAFA